MCKGLLEEPWAAILAYVLPDVMGILKPSVLLVLACAVSLISVPKDGPRGGAGMVQAWCSDGQGMVQ